MEMNKLSGAISLGLLLCVVTFSPSVEGCSCMAQHPQTQYCNAEYVIAAQIISNVETHVPNSIAYEIEIKKIYKMSSKGVKLLEYGVILTQDSDSACGIRLDKGRTYVIAGQGRSVTICHYVKLFKELTKFERHGFVVQYRKGCGCEINNCYSQYLTDCPEEENSCLMKPDAKCEKFFSACVPKSNGNGCQWRETSGYKNCTS